MFYIAPSRERRRQKDEPLHHIVLAARTPVLTHMVKLGDIKT
jgi:hypothetical protein